MLLGSVVFVVALAIVFALSVVVGYLGSPDTSFDWALASRVRHGVGHDAACPRDRWAGVVHAIRNASDAGPGQGDEGTAGSE
jgi:hypothetical protein